MIASKIFLGCLITTVSLGVVEVVTTATDHVQTVSYNCQLEAENTQLREENAYLKANSDTFHTNLLLAVDSLRQVIEARDITINDIEQDIAAVKNQLENEKRRTIASMFSTTPYRLEPITISTPDSY